jgi:ABC-type amino acid transport substrate-binding protein
VLRAILFAILALALSGCATARKLDAANDVHTLLIAIRDNDPAAFEAHVDRRALKRVIEARLMSEARKDDRLSGIAAILAPGLAELAGEALVQPSVFRAVAEHYGYSRQTKIPNAIVISQALRRLPDGRVCAVSRKDGPCLLVFTKAPDGRWKLSGFEGDLSMLRLKG